MSYTIPNFTVGRDDLRSVTPDSTPSDDSPVDDVIGGYVQQLDTGTRCHDEILEQLAAALPGIDIIAGCVGRAGDEVSVQVYGHVNEGHADDPDWARENFTVSVSVVRAPSRPAAETGEGTGENEPLEPHEHTQVGAGGPVEPA